MPILLIIGAILAISASLASLVFHIITLVKAFKAGDVLWGVLTLIFGIPGLIWLFKNDEASLGKKYLIATVLSIIGVVLVLTGAAAIESAKTTVPAIQ